MTAQLRSESRNQRGGTFCQFTVGASERGASPRHIRYIANPQAVREGHEGIWLHALPTAVTEAAAGYALLVQRLCQYAKRLENEDIRTHRARGNVRTHYAAILSFERSVGTPQVRQMLAAWLEEAFPKAQAAAFVHRNTAHLHSHVWIAARQTDGRKISLSARAFRQLDEIWNRIYSREMHRDEREHLRKKGQTERCKQLRREGKASKRPERVAHLWSQAEFNARERERLGAEYDRDEKGDGGYQWQAAGEPPAAERGEQSIAELRLPAARETDPMQRAGEEAEQTVSEAARLYQDAQKVAERQRRRDLDLERER